MVPALTAESDSRLIEAAYHNEAYLSCHLSAVVEYLLALVVPRLRGGGSSLYTFLALKVVRGQEESVIIHTFKLDGNFTFTDAIILRGTFSIEFEGIGLGFE